MIDLTTRSGKYRIVFDEYGQMTIYRNGEEWILHVKGQKMIIELCCELEELRAKAPEEPQLFPTSDR